MPPYVTPAIPASQIVDVVPSVLSAGGNALDLIGMLLTNSTRVPIGTIYQFPTAATVSSFFGPLSQEAALASIYFLGFDNSSVKPGNFLATQYNLSPVPAYLRGGNITTVGLAGVKAVNGTLSVTIDGTVYSGTVNLSTAVSYSTAAQIIADTLDIPSLPVVGTFTGAISATVLTVTVVLSGTLGVGDVISGTGVTPGTYITSLGTGTGGVGTYNVSASQTVASTTITAVQPAALFTGSIATTVLTVTAVTQGALAVGQIISGAGVTAGTYISSLGTGTGGIGTYNLSASQSVLSEVMTADAPGVTFDSVTNAFVITSGTFGATSTIGFATGTAAAPLLLTQATGAILSQGADGLAPNTGQPTLFMDNVMNITQNWCSFMTGWEPSDADKENFALWTNNQNDRFLYCMWTTNAINTGQSGPEPAIATINAGNYSGIASIWDDPTIDTMGGQMAAFLMGYPASLNFTEFNGRTTAAFRSQTGLQTQVVRADVAQNLIGYGINFYGDYTTANQAFLWLQEGMVSGPFMWLDSYVDQIWFTNQLQIAGMLLMANAKSIPYNVAGYGLVQAGLTDPITLALNFGAIRTGITLSAAQTIVVNSQAGLNIATTLTQRGWYILIVDAPPQVRQERGPPQVTLFYTDGGSIQKLVINSILIQ